MIFFNISHPGLHSGVVVSTVATHTPKNMHDRLTSLIFYFQWQGSLNLFHTIQFRWKYPVGETPTVKRPIRALVFTLICENLESLLVAYLMSARQ